MIYLSIIIPAYNAEEWIQSLLQSLYSQDDANRCEYEVIVVNDGSTDDTWKAIKLFADTHTDLQLHYYNQDNLGVSAARNHGIEHAQGQFCWFVDADDMIAPIAMKTLIPIIKERNVDAIKMGACVEDAIDDSGNIIINKCPIPDMSETTELDGYKLLGTDYVFGHTTLLFKRRLIINHRVRYPENIHNNEDYLFVIRFLIRCGRIYMNRTLQFYIYRDLDVSLSRGNHTFESQDKKLRNSVLVMEMLNKERKLVSEDKKTTYDYTFHRLVMSCLVNLAFSGQKGYVIRYYLHRYKELGVMPYKHIKVIHDWKFLIYKSSALFYMFSQLCRIYFKTTCRV